MNKMEGKYTKLLMFVLFFAIIALWGCPKRTEVTSLPETPREEAPTAQQAPAEQGAQVRTEKEEVKENAPAAVIGLQPVYFDFDQSFIRADAKEIMKANAEWLKAHPQARIKIEGNCDERGTREYNQALGQRRAATAKKFLTDLGISPTRISLISYGKEKPTCAESTESCWQKNRRDDFVVSD
jgi:peptidoglycan-associated lipoprotein